MATSSTSSTIPPENTLPPTTSSLPPVTTSIDPGVVLPTSATTVTPVVDGAGGFPSSINTTETSPPPVPPPEDLIPGLLPVFAPVVSSAASPVNTFSTCIDEAAVDITPVSPIAGTCTCSTVTVTRPNPNTPVNNVPDLLPVSGPVIAIFPNVPVITDNTSDTSTAPNYIASFIGKSVSKFNNIMYRGAVQGLDGQLYIVPYASDNLTVTNLSNGAQVGYDITSFARPRSLAKFIGGAIAPSGKIYLGPQEASSPLIIDTNQTPPTLTQVSGGSGSAQARGPAYYNNKVYIPTYKNGTTQKWLVVNTDNDTLEPAIIQPAHPTTDEIFLTRVDYASENSGNAIKDYDSLEGAVAGDNGKIYGMPYGASRINIVDTATQTSTWGADYITGNAPIDNDLYSNRSGGMIQTKTYFNKYKYGALANNGNIYAHGHRARSILKIDTSDDSATEIPYPQVIIDAMLNGGSEESADTAKAASFGSVLGSDGKVYSTPWNIPYLIWIDPTDDSIGYLEISDILESSESNINNGWYTLATAVGNKLYFSPGTAEKILVIELPESNSGTSINPLGEPTLTFDTNPIDPAVNINFDNESGEGAEPIVEGGGFDPALINNFTCEDADVSWYLEDAYVEWFYNVDTVDYSAGEEGPTYVSEALLASMIRDGRMSGNEVGDGTFEINAFSGNAVQFSNNEIVVEGSKITVNGQELPSSNEDLPIAQNLPIGSQTIDLVKVKEGIVKSVDPPVVANYKGQLHLFVVTIEIPQGYTNYPGTIECILLGTSYKEDDVVFTDIETGGTDTNSGPIQRPAVTIDNNTGKIIETGGSTDITGTSKEPTPLNLVCYDDGDNVLSFKQDGANPFWKIGQNAQQGAANIRVQNFPFNPSTVYNLPVGTLVKPLLDLENDPGNIVEVTPDKVPDTVDKRVKYKVKLSIPDRYDNSDEDYLYCSVYSYLSALSALSGRELKCYGDNNDATTVGEDDAGVEIDYANPTWNAVAANLVGQVNIANFPGFNPSTIFNIPIGTPISPLIDIEIGTLAKVTPLTVPDNDPGPIRVEVEIEVPKDQGYINEGEIKCYMEMFPPITGTTTGTPPPPPPPPPPGVPLDECMLECLTYTTPGPAQPGNQRPVPVRLTIPIERTTIPPVFPLNPPSNRTVPPTVPPPGTTPTTSTTTTTTINPCPPECDIPSF